MLTLIMMVISKLPIVKLTEYFFGIGIPICVSVHWKGNTLIASQSNCDG
jgi:hypothetical protein